MRRRSFLKRSALVSANAMVPSFLRLSGSKPLVSNGKILIVIQLSGGNDGLNCIVPYGDDLYYKSRPTLAIAASKLYALDEYQGLHPELMPMADLYADGKISILNAVGYPNPNRSHFRSMDIWHAGCDPDQNESTGWLGRYLDGECEGCATPYHAIEIGDNLGMVLRGKVRNGFAMRDPIRLQKATNNNFLLKLGKHYDGVSSSEPLEFLYKTMIEAQESAAYLSSQAKTKRTQSSYPLHSFGMGMQQIANLILSDCATKIYYISLPGFDTHINQNGRHQRLLGVYAQAVRALTDDLQRQGLFDRVAIVTFSEFGRRVAENGSRGTDHGAANNVLVLSGALQTPGIYNPPPNLQNLLEGDLRYQIDFRSVYANILEDWLEIPSTAILPGFQSQSLNIL